MAGEEALKRDEGGDVDDYVLKEGFEGVWVTVGSISVHVVRTDEGVVVALYPEGDEADVEAIASTWATFADAREASEGE